MSVRVKLSMHIIKMLETTNMILRMLPKYHDNCDNTYDNNHGKVHGSKNSIDGFYELDDDLDKYPW